MVCGVGLMACDSIRFHNHLLMANIGRPQSGDFDRPTRSRTREAQEQSDVGQPSPKIDCCRSPRSAAAKEIPKITKNCIGS